MGAVHLLLAQMFLCCICCVSVIVCTCRSHPSTDGEIKELCRDLQVCWLGFRDMQTQPKTTLPYLKILPLSEASSMPQCCGRRAGEPVRARPSD